MSMSTSLKGRLRNTTLPMSQGLLPVFEAVVNSMQGIEALESRTHDGQITVEILRSAQSSLALDDIRGKRGAPPTEPIVGFKIIDTGVGFDDENFKSFETLDSEFKVKKGCRGVGRLLWLKAFSKVSIKSTFIDTSGILRTRSFDFDALNGVVERSLVDAPTGATRRTEVHLDGFKEDYRDRAAKTGATIAGDILEHCIWYFVRDGGAPKILVRDGGELIRLQDTYDEYMVSSSSQTTITLKGQSFEITHLKLKASLAKQPFIAWGAAGRMVEQESIGSKVPGLYGRLKDDETEFVYAAYVTSPYLDQAVRSERIGFDLRNDLFEDDQISMTELRTAVLGASQEYLKDFLAESCKASKERVAKFVAERAPRYRPVLARMSPDKLAVDPEISDRDLDLLLHRQLAEIEGELLSEGHSIMQFSDTETEDAYRARMAEYLTKVGELKQSDLVNYVFHRKTILDILAKAIERGTNGKYAREELIHQLIMPLRKTSDEIKLDSCNLWLIDERLAFHDFLASDKTLAAMPITGATETNEPDICALNVYDEPLLVSEGAKLPLASIVVVEIKRPMRNDAAAGEDKDPIEQALSYLDRIRAGGSLTATGRPIPRSEDIPGFCYAICDITPSIERRCKLAGLKVTSDRQGYFGYNDNYKAYVEVISFDKLLNSARERNRAFFDKLGLPTS